MIQDVVVAELNVLSHYFPGRIGGKKCDKTSGWSVSRPVVERGISLIEVRILTP